MMCYESPSVRQSDHILLREIQPMLEVPLLPHVVSTTLEVFIDCSSKIDMVSW